MKLLNFIAVLVLAPLYIATSAFADESKGEKETAASKKPSLTYYYLEG